jgi:hypothetical protein
VKIERLNKLEQLIIDHPLIAVSGAFLVGATIGLLRAPPGRVGRAIGAAVSALAISAVREAAFNAVSGYAKSWIDQRDRQTKTSYEPAVETMFEH